MGKIDNKVQQVPVTAIKPYEKNAKLHSAEQIEKIAASIEEFGFISPCLIDKDRNLLAGHGRIEAAKLLGLESVPCICVDDLTLAQKRAYILADNRLTEMSTWNQDILEAELSALNDMNFDVDLTGFELTIENDWFENRERWDDSGEGESDEYNEFLEKFEQKKTTDDCYTPDSVYEAVADYVTEAFGVPKEKMIRPFYPGGDYANEKYPKGYVVVDNPPFSIMSEIIRFYTERDIPFFLFAPTLTLFSTAQSECCTAMAIGVAITYENGAAVNTSFLTNMLDGIRVKTDPELYDRLYEANKNTLRNIHKELPKFEYPAEVITAAGIAALSKYGVAFEVPSDHCARITELDAQADYEKSIYGGGYLLSREYTEKRKEADSRKEKKVKEEPVIVWELSDREREMVEALGGVADE